MQIKCHISAAQIHAQTHKHTDSHTHIFTCTEPCLCFPALTTCRSHACSSFFTESDSPSNVREAGGEWGEREREREVACENVWERCMPASWCSRDFYVATSHAESTQQQLTRRALTAAHLYPFMPCPTARFACICKRLKTLPQNAVGSGANIFLAVFVAASKLAAW